MQEGDRLFNPPYARLLRKIATDGADAFYKGGVAERIVKATREDYENPGLLSVEDFSTYQAQQRKPVCGTYRAHQICSVGEPTSGGLSVLIALGILEKFNMAALGKDNPEKLAFDCGSQPSCLCRPQFIHGRPILRPVTGGAVSIRNIWHQRAALISETKPNRR